MDNGIFALFIVYQLKHFLADYPLQNSFMLGKFKPNKDFILPLTAHCGVHSFFTLVIASIFITSRGKFDFPFVLFLAALDFVAHFIMDRIKASPELLGKFKPLSPSEYMKAADDAESMSDEIIDHLYETGDKDAVSLDQEYTTAKQKLRHNKYFWWCLGLDQTVHHLTHYFIIYLLLGF